MIAPGHQVFRGLDGGWRYATPDEEFVRVDGPDEVLAMLADPPHDPGPRFAQLVGALTDRGVLVADVADVAAAPPVARVRVEGNGPIADRVRELIGAAVDAEPEVVVSVAGWVPDEEWRARDIELREQGVAWHRVHAEGTGLVLGPFSVPGATASYRDTRGRRLAAAPVPDELLGLWAHLAGPTAAPPPPVPAPTAAVAAGLVAADVLAHVRGAPIPSAGYQLVLAEDLTITRHPVLPLPDLG